MIAVEPSLRMAVQHPTKQGRGQGHEGYPAVAHWPFYQYAEGKEAQYGAVSVAGKGVNGIYHAGVVQYVEHDDGQSHHHGHAYVHAFAHSGNFVFAALACSQYVYGERSGECGERRACCIVGRGRQTNDEQHANHAWQQASGGYCGEKLVASSR